MLKFKVLISGALTFLFLVPLVSSSQKAFSLLLDIYKDDTVVLKSFEVVELEGVSFDKGTGNYSFIVFSAEEKLYEIKLDIVFEVWEERVDPETGEMYGELITVDPQEVYIRLPYFREADGVEIYHLNKLIFRYEICQINNVCEEGRGENLINCPEDCILCGNNKLDPGEECESLADCTIQEFPYASCTGDRDCTDCQCIGILTCDGTTCSIGSEDYCNYCPHCGDGVCNCRENFETCPQECESPIRKMMWITISVIVLIVGGILVLIYLRSRP